MSMILIVDDHPTNRQFLVTLLGYAGHVLREASDGQEALELARGTKFDLIISDLHMPNMDGPELVRRLRVESATADVPMMFYTATYSLSEAKAMAHSAGVSHVLQKPVEPELVLKTVAEILGGPIATAGAEGGGGQTFQAQTSLSPEMMALQASSMRFASVLELNLMLARQRDPIKMVDDFCLGARRIIGSTYAAVGMLKEDGRSLSHFFMPGPDDLPVACLGGVLQAATVMRGLMGRRKVCRQKNPGGDPQRFGFPHDHPPIHSILAILIASRNSTHGWLYFFNKIGADGFSAEDERLASALANQMAIAWENRQLFVELHRRATQLEAEVAERQRAEEDRIQLLVREQAARAEAEHANSAKDRFLAIVSHELRTPLTPVLLRLELLRQEPNLSEEISSGFDMIRRNIEMEARIIDDLLDLASVASGKFRLNLESVDARAIIQSVIELFREELRNKQLELSTDLNAGDSFVRADPNRLRQIVWNLLGNAIRFTPAGGKICIASESRADGLFALCVSDSGIGVDSKFIPHVFEAFQQAEHPASRRFGGLGLGMTITKALVEIQGGKIGVSSAGVNCGATFTIELPSAASPIAIASPTSEASASGLRILFVEDNEDTLRILAKLLVRQGHEVTTANSSESALRAEAAGRFDVLISDIGLPDGSGWELMRTIGRRRPIAGIAVSGFATDEDIRRSHEAGFLEHLTKPLNIRRLNELLKEIADRIIRVPQPTRVQAAA